MKGIVRFFKTRPQHPWQNFLLLTFILSALLINALGGGMALLIGSDMNGYQFETEAINSIFIFLTCLLILALCSNTFFFGNKILMALNILISIMSIFILSIYLSFIPEMEILERTYCRDNIVLTRYKYHEIGFVGNRTNLDTFKQIIVFPGVLKNTGQIVEFCEKIKP